MSRSRLGFRLIAVALVAAGCAPSAADPALPPAPTAPPPTAVVAPAPAPTPTARPQPTTTTVPPTPAPTVPPPSPTPGPPVRALACGDVVRESVTLAADLACPGHALLVEADGVVLDLGGHTISGPGIGPPSWPNPNLQSVAVRVIGRSDVVVRNGRLERFSTGVLLDRTRHAVVEGIEARDTYYGIYLRDSEESVVRASTFVENVYGLTLLGAARSRIEGNVSSRQRHLSPGGYGIYLYRCVDNLIVGNTFDSNVNWGIWLSESQGNVFYHNNVVRNNPQVSDDTGGNVWHDVARREGNFWSDWQGNEIPGTGIGDRPYPIGGPGGASDPFPFVRRDGWEEPGRRPAPAGPAPSPTRAAAAAAPWISLPSAGQLAAVAPDGATLVASVPVERPASNLASSPDGRRLYLVAGAPAAVGVLPGAFARGASGAALLVLDARSGALLDSYPLPASGRAVHLIADRDGRHLHLLDGVALSTLDLDGRTWAAPLDYPAEVAAAFASWKHQLLLVANRLSQGVDVVWVGGGRISYTIPLGGTPRSLAANRAGTRLYVAVAGAEAVRVVETEQYAVVDELRADPDGREWLALAAAPDGGALYGLQAGGDLVAIDLASRAVRYRQPLASSATRLAASLDGARLYVGASDEDGGGVLLTLRAEDGALLSRLALPSAPGDLLAGP